LNPPLQEVLHTCRKDHLGSALACPCKRFSSVLYLNNNIAILAIFQSSFLFSKCERLLYKMPNPSLLLVDNKVNAAGELKAAFEKKGYQVTWVRNGSQALKILSSTSIDLMLLDLELADCNGLELLKTARMESQELLIILKTGQATIESAVMAIKLDVNDYFVEPVEAFQIESSIENIIQKKQYELHRNKKIRSIIEAVKTLENGILLSRHDERLDSGKNSDPDPTIVLDKSKRQLIFANQKLGNDLQVELTSHEYALLSYLMEFSEKVLSSRELALKTLGYTNISEKEAKGIIRPHISRLRKKIEINPDHPQVIRTIRGRGYVFTQRKSNS
jgi:DNA-binding response OmpR family regulator